MSSNCIQAITFTLIERSIDEKIENQFIFSIETVSYSSNIYVGTDRYMGR